MANISQTMSKGVIDDENNGFLNSISKCVWDVVINSSNEPIKTRIARKKNKEEKRYINTLESVAETITEFVESSENEETYFVAERFSKYLICKRKTNLNFPRSKTHSRKQD
ncbi:hypothetical protein V8G54_032392 [Vigna mungo]|uniref:Uncharacterized protein n=1 Tax=Vigna mungo TaxID=3915 RepID=A0AAQ3MMC8_VIGMU